MKIKNKSLRDFLKSVLNKLQEKFQDILALPVKIPFYIFLPLRHLLLTETLLIKSSLKMYVPFIR